MLRRIAIGLVLALLVALPATAQDFEKGMQAYKRGDYATAFKNWRPLAAKGIVAAQFNLGLMYAQSQGVPRDYGKAVEWYRKAAEQGVAKAQFNLGLMYFDGLGVTQDYAEGAKWYRKAACRYPPGEDRDQAVKNRDIVAKRMTPAQISEAQKLAREWRLEKTMTRRWRRIRERWLPSMTGPM